MQTRTSPRRAFLSSRLLSSRLLPGLLLSLAAALTLSACSGAQGGASGGAQRKAQPQAQASGSPSQGTQKAFSGGNAIRRSEVPYETLLAETRRTGRPAVLFFWTSW